MGKEVGVSINLENLRKLRNGIKRRILNGTINQDTFDMTWFRQRLMGGGEQNFYDKNNCGTVGCVLGWAPMIKGLEYKLKDFGKYYQNSNELSFNAYCERVFNIDSNSNLWDFLFDGDWTDYDNTPEGAVARMDLILKFPDLMDEVEE